jgi:hypothetical protein
MPPAPAGSGIAYVSMRWPLFTFQTETCSPAAMSVSRISASSMPMLPMQFRSAAVTTA